jgi:hypothetical protein
LLLPESAGFLYEGEKLTYAVTADDPCYSNEKYCEDFEGVFTDNIILIRPNFVAPRPLV